MKIITQLKTFFYFQKIVSQHYKSYPFVLSAVILSSSISPFIFVIFPRYILDEIFGSRDLHKVITYLVLMAVAIEVTGFTTAIFQNRLHFISMKLKSKLRMEMAYKTTKIQYAWLEDADMLNLKQQVTQFLEEDIDKIIFVTPTLISYMLASLGYVYIISSLNIVILIIILTVIGVSALIQEKTEKYAYQYRKDMAPLERRIAYFIMNMPNHKYAKDIRLFDLSGWLYKKYAAQLDAALGGYKQVFNRRSHGAILISLANLLQTVSVYAWLIYKTFLGQLTVGQFTMYFSAISNFSGSITGILNSWIQITNVNQGVYDYKKYMSLENEDAMDSSVLYALPSMPCIEFKNVSFKYPNQSKFALKNIHIKIPYGQKIAIVGENGAGKTTFIKLLMRLYEPTEGEILINNINIKNYSIRDYRNLFAAVFQDYTIFSFSIKENVALQTSQEKGASDLVMDALERAGLASKISNLPKGVDTSIDTVFDDSGIQLSGGESQKLAIARAAYRNSPILVLDEPTAALDPRAEYAIYKSFHEMVGCKLAFFVSHRLSSSQLCDRILVFDKGEIIEDGNHASLLKANGLYAELYAMQAEYYAENTQGSTKI